MAEPAQERRWGAFGLGFHAEAGIGLVEGLGPGGTALHPVPRVGLQYDVPQGFSVPLSFRFQRGIVVGQPTFSQLVVSSGILIRRHAGHGIVIGPGAGLRIGGLSTSRELLGLGPNGDPNEQKVVGFPVAPYAHLAMEWWPYRGLAAKVTVEYAPLFFEAAVLHTVEEMLSLALCL